MAIISLLSFHLRSRNIKVKIYKTIIVPVVLYGCGTWSLVLREEQRLRVLEKGSKENIWTKVGRSNMKLEEVAERGAS
jgi:hypothetical protein